MQQTLPSLAGGRYRATRFLGEGAHKRVYLATDTLLEREVALALIKSTGQDEVALERVHREARSMAAFGSQPYIVTVFDTGSEGDAWYIVTEFMAGGDLATLIAQAPDHRLPLDTVLVVGTAVCRALALAHERGIVHRDLKPGNIWLSGDGAIKLGDFGIAVALDRARITHEGAIVGTPAYLAPEQALGGDVTGRADLYSLGVVLYELVTGRRPFVADDALAVIYQHIYAQPVAPTWHRPDLPAEFGSLIMQLLAKAPEERPADAPAVAGRLATIAASAADGASTPAAAAPAQPANQLDRLAAGVFVGRVRELDELRAAIDEAHTGATRVALLAGEPGAGKTSIAAEAATYARVRGFAVYWGRCFQEGSQAYWPWVQIMRDWVRDRPDADLLNELGAGAADVAQVVTDIRLRLPGLPEQPMVEDDQSRLRMFESVARFVRSGAISRPTLLVFDDLQWADRSSVLLLQFLAREARDVPLLLIGAYRDESLERTHPLALLTAELARLSGVRRIPLTGLSEREVGRLIEITTAAQPPAGLAEVVFRQTEGNPFFVAEVVRLLAAEQRLTEPQSTRWSVEIPQGVREVVGMRLAHLTESCLRLLRVASVIGRHFELDLLESVAGSDDDPLDLLAEAEQARIVAEDTHRIGRYEFTHGLVRETLYEGISRTRRAREHRRIGEALEKLSLANPGPHLAELAYHFVAAAPLGDTEKAVRYARLAGDRARGLLAYEEAARHYGLALEAIAAQSERDERGSDAELLRCDLLLALGEVQNRADDLRAAELSFDAAAELALSQERADQLARAALGIADVEPVPGANNSRRVHLLEAALRLLGDAPAAARARVMARLALELYFGESAERTTALARGAVLLARQLDDPGALAFALHAERMVTGWSDDPGNRLSVAEEIIRLSNAAGDREVAITGQLWKLCDLFEMGDAAGGDRQIAVCGSLARELRQPVYEWYSALTLAMRAMLAGRFDEAEQLAGKALVIGQRAHESTALQLYAGQLLIVRREQGRLAELEPVVRGLAMQNPDLMAWHGVLSFIAGEIGRTETAQSEFEVVAQFGFEKLPRDVLWLATLTVLAESCALLQDAPRAAELYRLLRPFADRNIVLANALACMGAGSYYLGLLAEAMGDLTLASDHLAVALSIHQRLDSPPWLARTRLAQATVLLREYEGNPGSTVSLDSALELLRAVLGMPETLGMSRIRDQALALVERLNDIAAQSHSAD